MENLSVIHPDIYEYALPDKGISSPLVVDLPHGGDIYPPDFNFSCPRSALELCEEKYLNELFFAPTLASGGAVLQAKFPRTYVDVNRAANDIDQLLFETPWMEPTATDGRSVHGFGVIMRHIRAGEPIYSHPLSHSEVRNRIEKYYSFYHNALNEILNKTHEKFDVVYHLNCHSMPSSVLSTHFPHLQPDIILGDKDGRSCGPDFRQTVAETLKDMGYRVAINQLYKGAEIITRYGQPSWGRHSLQIEINRAIFSNEATGEKSNNFNAVKKNVQTIIEKISAE